MLVIRERQFKALARAALSRWLVNHLQEHFPDECEELGLAVVREAVRHGIERAASHGFTYEVHISKYVDLMFALGRDFDTNPLTPWASAMLADRSVNASARMDRLCDAAVAHLKAADAVGLEV
ncbi:MAG TPA: hypothetical protein VN428_13755 [Bryobacteraceae bacterium]|nr:hypothetical protein [Bryobacteraceae bacterium]